MTRLTKHTAQQQMTQNMLPMGDLYASVVDKLAQKQHFQTANTEPGGSGGARGRSSPILGSSSSSATSPDGSSLDYKVPPGSSSTSLTHPPPTSKGPAMMGSMTPEEHFERQQQQQSRRPRHQHFKTRARGSSGLPPRKVTYEELSHMDQESFLKALYDDPELAQAVAQEHAKEQQRSSGAKMKRSQTMKSQQRSEDSKQHRRAAGSGAVGTETEFLEELKKGGIPVVTWTVLIIVIVGALYKLYQWLAGPQAKGKPHHTNRGGGVTTLRKSKAKQPKAKQPHSQNTNQQQQLPVEEEKVVLELADAVGPSSIENSSTKKKKSTGKVAKKKPPNNKQQKSSSTSKQPQQTTPPEEVAPVAKEKINSGAVAPVTESWEETQAGDGEWQTVRKRADSTSKFPDKAEGEEHLSTPPPENGASLKPNGKKKKKKATGESSADTIKQPSSSAGDNAGSALASDSGATKQVVTADESKVVAADSEKPEHSAGKAEPASATTEKVGNGELVKGNTSSLQEDSVNKNKEDRQGVADDPLPVNGKESALLSPSDKPYQDVQNGIVNKDIAVGSSSATESKEENGGAKPDGGASSKASNANGAGDQKKKKSGKSQRKAASQPKTPPVPPVNPATTKNDALLALELQTQEEELAKQEAAAVAAAVAASSENPPAEKEDVWEEVTVRRKRVNRPTTENTTPSVAVTPAMTTAASAAAFDDDDDDE